MSPITEKKPPTNMEHSLVKKQERLAIRWHDEMFSSFDTILDHDRQTRQTDRQTDNLQ